MYDFLKNGSIVDDPNILYYDLLLRQTIAKYIAYKNPKFIEKLIGLAQDKTIDINIRENILVSLARLKLDDEDLFINELKWMRDDHYTISNYLIYLIQHGNGMIVDKLIKLIPRKSEKVLFILRHVEPTDKVIDALFNFLSRSNFLEKGYTDILNYLQNLGGSGNQKVIRELTSYDDPYYENIDSYMINEEGHNNISLEEKISKMGLSQIDMNIKDLVLLYSVEEVEKRLLEHVVDNDSVDEEIKISVLRALISLNIRTEEVFKKAIVLVKNKSPEARSNLKSVSPKLTPPSRKKSCLGKLLKG